MNVVNQVLILNYQKKIMTNAHLTTYSPIPARIGQPKVIRTEAGNEG